MGKTKRLVTLTAGRLVHAVCYTQAMPVDGPRERAKKAQFSSEARKRMNFRCSYEKLQLLTAANFCKRDLFVTLSYDDAHLPASRKAADAEAARFLRRFGDARRRAGEPFKYIRSTQELTDDGGRRLHHHLVINAGAERRDYELIRSLWCCGGNIGIQQICASDHYQHDDFFELAKYLARERDPDAPLTAVGARSWSGSRNLDKPVRESALVDGNLTVEAPPGAFVLDTDERRNEFGTFKYIKYLLPERAEKPAPIKRPVGRRNKAPPAAKPPG